MRFVEAVTCYPLIGVSPFETPRAKPKYVHKPIAFIDLKRQYEQMRVAVNARISAVLEHGQYILGPEVGQLEAKLADYTGAKHCITCSSGTDALLIALMALNIGPGDEVITTPFTFIATAEVIALLGAIPVFVDIEPDTYIIDAARIEAAITTRTRVIMPVSLYGQPADMDTINQVASRHGLAVIEDGAQSFGAEYKGKKSGNLSTIGCTSFFPSKPLGCYGDGGAIFTSDDQLAQAMREIRVHGQRQRYVHDRLGLCGRMDTLQCAIVLAKLEHFEQEVVQRRYVSQMYARYLAEIGIRPPVIRGDRTSVYAQYTIEVENRERIKAVLEHEGVPTAVHYPLPLTSQPALACYMTHEYNLACAETASARVLSLPMHPYLEESEIASIVNLLGRALS